MKVLFLTNVPSPYRVDFFNELGKSCDLTVLFEKKSSDERDESWNNYTFKNFTGVILKGISLNTDTAFSFGTIKYLKDKSYDFIICANFSSPTGIIAVSYMRRHGIRYLLETDGGSPKNGKGFKEWLKTRIIKGAFGCLSTSAENDKYFLAYGAKRENIFRYPFTSLYEDDISQSVADGKTKALLREELNICEQKVVISVGRFSYLNGYGKGYDVLMRAAQALPKEIGWYIVGGQPMEEFEDLLEKSKLTNFHFVDFKLKDELKKYYRASDLFVLMTVGEAWGLVLNEAMACGLPVITTDKCIAGTELIKGGENGYLLKVGDDKALTEIIDKIIFKDDILSKMGCNAIETVKGYTFEEMVVKHLKIFKDITQNGNE